MIKLILDLLEKKLWSKFPSFKQFLKFSIVGAINTGVDFTIYLSLTRLIPWFMDYFLVANAVSFTFAASNSYYLNKRWTFKDKSKENQASKYLKFIGINIVSLIFVEIALYYLVSQFGIFDIFAKILTLLISVVINFSLSKVFVFNK